MQTPVLMIHGMCCNGEIWANFRAYFEAHGTRVFTPTLRPDLRVGLEHSAPRALRSLGFADYVSDLEEECARIALQIGRRPAVVGHSMGGLLALTLAQRGAVCSAVLMTPAVSVDIRTIAARIFWARYRLAHRLGLIPVVRVDRRTLRTRVFNQLPKPQQRDAERYFVYESGRAVAEMGRWAIDESQIRVPVLTVGASKDRLVEPALVRGLGRKLARCGGEYHEYARHGHWLFSEPGWEVPAASILSWLQRASSSTSETTAALASGSVRGL